MSGVASTRTSPTLPPEIQGSQSEPLRRVRVACKATSSFPHACASFNSVGDCLPPPSKVCYNSPPAEAGDFPAELKKLPSRGAASLAQAYKPPPENKNTPARGASSLDLHCFPALTVTAESADKDRPNMTSHAIH